MVYSIDDEPFIVTCNRQSAPVEYSLSLDTLTIKLGEPLALKQGESLTVRMVYLGN